MSFIATIPLPDLTDEQKDDLDQIQRFIAKLSLNAPEELIDIACIIQICTHIRLSATNHEDRLKKFTDTLGKLNWLFTEMEKKDFPLELQEIINKEYGLKTRIH